MLGVCFVPPSSDHDVNHWSYVLTHFVPDAVYLWQDVKKLSSAYPLYVRSTHIHTAEELPSSSPLVLLAPKNGRYVQGQVSLHDFEHPLNAIYLFGSDHHHMSSDFLGARAPEHTVYIPTDAHAEMYSHVAAAITLFDRKRKVG